ncbi:MAG: CinA family protein [Mycobacteriales bacterium]
MFRALSLRRISKRTTERTTERATVKAETRAAAVGHPVTAAQCLAILTRTGRTVAVAESLTGGMLAAVFTSVPGASKAFRGGLVVYASDLKASLAGVPAEMLATYGPVSEPVAAALAAGVRERLRADFGLATTGVAGPDKQDGIDVGTVYVALAAGGRPTVEKLQLDGTRARIRGDSMTAAVELLGRHLVT